MCKALLHATLAHEEEGNEDFTPMFVGRLVKFNEYEMVFAKLAEALTKSMPDKDEADEEGNAGK